MTMLYRIRLLHLAAVALALAACCVCARDVSNGRQRASGALQLDQRPANSLQAGANSGPLSSKRRRNRRSAGSVPRLTLATGLRGGGRGGAAVDVPRGGGSTVATGVKRSAKVKFRSLMTHTSLLRTHVWFRHLHQPPLQHCCRGICEAGCHAGSERG